MSWLSFYIWKLHSFTHWCTPREVMGWREIDQIAFCPLVDNLWNNYDIMNWYSIHQNGYPNFDKNFTFDCTESCHFGNFQCSQRWKFCQNDISFSLLKKSVKWVPVFFDTCDVILHIYTCCSTHQFLSFSSKHKSDISCKIELFLSPATRPFVCFIKTCHNCNRACHPGGLYWDYYPVALSLNQVTTTHLKIMHP